MTCPSCQAPLFEGARFCGVCGKAFAATETQSNDTRAPGAGPELAGREIAGRYRIVAKLGEGGMGAVFRAEQISLKRAVALKLLRPEMSSNANLLRRFNAEAELVAKLSHPNTVNIYDFGQDTDGSLFIAMELIEGRSLRAVLRDAGPLAPARALAIAAQLAASLADAHAHGIVHRDLKPDNVMLQERGKERDIVRVLDFGIAKLRDDSRAEQPQMTQAGDMLGTPQYMAPEQIRSDAIDGRTDVYALGCILYEMLTARMPFEAPTVMALLSKHLMEAVVPPSQRRPDLGISPALDELVLIAMAKVPAARPPTMEAYGERIGALLRAYAPADTGGARASGLLVPVPAPKAAPWIAPMGYAGFEDRPPPPPEPVPAPPLPPSIPLGYGGVHAKGAAVGGLAAARAAAGPTEMVDPLPKVAFVRGPNGVMVARPVPAKSNMTLVLVLVSLGLAAVAGTGVVVYKLRHRAPAVDPNDPWSGGHAAAAAVDGSAPRARSALGISDTAPAIDPFAGADPWQDHADGDSALPTALMPLPPGAHLNTPWPTEQLYDIVGGLHYLDLVRGVHFYMVPLFPGTNDPRALAQRYVVDHPHLRLVHMETIESAGAERPTASFVGRDGPLDAPAGELGAMYVGHAYRVAVIVVGTPAQFQDVDFNDAIEMFFASGVVLP